jgi:hypothetical protein
MKTLYQLYTRGTRKMRWVCHPLSLSHSRDQCIATVYNPTPTLEATLKRNTRCGLAKMVRLKVKVVSKVTEPTGYDWREQEATSKAVAMYLGTH